VVIGANRPTGELDLEALEMLVEHSEGLGVSLHRAFDLVPDQSAPWRRRSNWASSGC
jgi:copper homeostasis protein